MRDTTERSWCHSDPAASIGTILTCGRCGAPRCVSALARERNRRLRAGPALRAARRAGAGHTTPCDSMISSSVPGRSGWILSDHCASSVVVCPSASATLAATASFSVRSEKSSPSSAP